MFYNKSAGWSSLVARWAQFRRFRMITTFKGDIAEQAAALHAMKRGWGVIKPVVNWLPYDLVFDIRGTLVKIQVKSAWFDQSRNNYVIDNRRTKTNRRAMLRESYNEKDFDFALAYLSEKDLFYIFPVNVFISYSSEIHLVEANKRQRKPRSANFRDAWNLILQWAAQKGTSVRSPVKLGETCSAVIPNQASKNMEEGVETRWQVPKIRLDEKGKGIVQTTN